MSSSAETTKGSSPKPVTEAASEGHAAAETQSSPAQQQQQQNPPATPSSASSSPSSTLTAPLSNVKGQQTVSETVAETSSATPQPAAAAAQEAGDSNTPKEGKKAALSVSTTPSSLENNVERPASLLSGRRTVSGTVTITGSFDQQDSSSSSPPVERRRSNTAPADIAVVPEENVLQESEKATLETPQKEQEAKKVVESKEPQQPTPAPVESKLAASSAPVQRLPSEDDEDIKLAKAMALAFEQHPHLSPAEIQDLVRKQQGSGATPAAAPSASTLLIPGRITSMFQQATTALSEETFSAMSSGPTSARPASAPVSGSSIVNKDANNYKKAQPVRKSFRNMGETFKKRVAKTNLSDLLSTGKATVVPEDATSESGGQSTAGGGAAGQDHPTTMNSFPQTPSSAASTGSKKRIKNLAKNIRSPPISPDVSNEVPREITNAVAAAAVPAEGLLQKIQTTPSMDSGSAHNDIDGSERGFTLPTLFARSPSFIGGTAAGGGTSAPVRLSGTAWKRRSGFGKFSSTSAWERRRIELRGSMLLYYQDPQSEANTPVDGISPSASKEQPEGDGGEAATDSELNEESEHEGVVVVNSSAKKATWFEQAAATLSHAANAESPTSAPRGHIDLAKDKATVHATHGHPGEPSPFAISIKVKGETKWKFCFDYHKSQMEWLVALTDIVVRTSVDHYNRALLDAAHPTAQTDEMLFHPPSVKEPPLPGEEKNEASQHRLWMMEPYLIRGTGEGSTVEDGQGLSAEEGAAAVEAAGESTERTLDSVDIAMLAEQPQPTVEPGTIESETEENDKVWSIPEKNLAYLVGVLNAALLYARASSTTMDGFWYAVVFSNLGLFLCLVKEPDWRRVIYQVQQLVTASLESTMPALGEEQSKVLKSVAKLKRAKPKKPAFIPVAGTTTVKLKNPKDPPTNADGEFFGGWRVMPGEILAVRSHGYSSTKLKVPSPGALYEVVNVDIFESPIRYPDMAARVKLPKAEFDDGGQPKTWRSPDIFVISIALPTDPPKLGGSSSDGGGYTVTMYYRMTQETRDILRRVTATGYDPSQEKVSDPQKSKVNAVRLFEEWCRRAPTDPKFMSRFKVVPNAHNLKEIGMPGWISKYNGKPFLIKRPGETGFLFKHPELSCMEFDISLHPFPFLAKKGICFMKDSYFKKILVSFGFVIEGRSDDELPECLIGLMQLCYPDPQYAIKADTFFAGTCHRSF